MRTPLTHDSGALAALSVPVRHWFAAAFPGGPTAAQELAWPAIAGREHVLLIAPTGTGKTLAAFLAILDGLFRDHAAGVLEPGLRCLYVSPLRSLSYDIERNLSEPLEGIRRRLGNEGRGVSVGVRTGDTSASDRRTLRDDPPHLLITTPESLSLLLSQPAWHAHWRGLRHIIVDEVHALVPTKRGADLAVSLERLAARAGSDPSRIGLSATCRPAAPVAQYLVGPTRSCRVLEAMPQAGAANIDLEVESLIQPGEAPHRGLTYRRLLRRLGRAHGRNRTTIVFANTRAFAEKLTHDLRHVFGEGSPHELPDTEETIAAHHSALDAQRRRAVERALKEGRLRMVVTSTSLELGIDIGSADLVVQVGLPGSALRCLQRVGRAGHQAGVASRGLLLAATPAELAGAVVTAAAARAGRVEPLHPVAAPLDVLCQQLIGMACGGEWPADEAFALVRRAGPMAGLSRADFDACLALLAGELAAPVGAFEPEPGAPLRWTSPRIWKRGGRFGIRSRRVLRWFWTNVGTIHSEESVRVVADGRDIGTLEAAYAERLQAGDRFVLDGRALEFRRLERSIVHARPSAGALNLPRWTSDRQSLSAELARELVRFREEAAQRLADGASALQGWLCETHRLDPEAAGLLVELFEAQQQWSEVPPPATLLVEQSPTCRNFGASGDGDEDGLTYTFHAPLGRAACEALGRATAARLGRRFGRDIALQVADLGWSIRLPETAALDTAAIQCLMKPEGLADDVIEGLDRGDLLARRFRHVAATALMVLRRPETGRRRVGGLLWVSSRLYPLVQAACPGHPLLRETRREVLDELLDLPSALAWLATRPAVRLRVLDAPSPFAAAWIDPAAAELLRYDPPGAALKRLHARLMATNRGPS
jgi:ATP-dependent Lhr-like helicase